MVLCYVAHYPRSSEGPSPETSRRRSGEWRPAAAARNRLAPGGSGPRPLGTTTWLRGARSTDPEEMPEKEARPPAQNRHGGAPRGERVPLDARRASGSADRRASATRDNRNSAPFGAPLAPHGADGKEESKTRAQQRAAGTKKTALFEIVNRNDAATRSGHGPSEHPGAPACAMCRSTLVGPLRVHGGVGRAA